MNQWVPAPQSQPTAPSPGQIAAARNRMHMRSGARWFYWIAALSAVNSVLFFTGSSWGFAIGLGMTDAANAFGQIVITGTAGAVVALAFDAMIAGGFGGLGWLAERGSHWAFVVGMVVYGIDSALVLWATDWLGLAFHGLAMFFIYRGFQASRALGAAAPGPIAPPGMAPPIHPR